MCLDLRLEAIVVGQGPPSSELECGAQRSAGQRILAVSGVRERVQLLPPTGEDDEDEGVTAHLEPGKVNEESEYFMLP